MEIHTRNNLMAVRQGPLFPQFTAGLEPEKVH
jgi:hypothetical protein